jgi:NAD(P)-dependent dehydrogenase (short-subunit alcohol dehydrogenase family)
MQLNNKIILVTGANRGIGAAIVRELLTHKVGKVYAAARNVKKLPDFGDRRAIPLALDITDTKQVQAAAEKAKDTQVLVNNAGTANLGTTLDNAFDAIVTDMNTNYYGTLHMMRAFAPVLQKNGQGLIANVISGAGLGAFPAIGSYSASKAAMHSLTQSMRGELAAKHIEVLGIYPGPIDTDMAKDFPMVKTSAAEAARNIIAGMIAGDEYIFPDPVSKEQGALWVNDPRGLEKLYAALSSGQQPEAKAV